MKTKSLTNAERLATWTPAAREEAKRMIRELPKFTSNQTKGKSQ